MSHTPALYVSLVDVPAMDEMQASGQDALTYFQRFFPKAYALQAPLTFAASAASLGHFIAGVSDTDRVVAAAEEGSGDSRVGWLMCGLLMGSQLPYTLKLLMPLNRQLLLTDAHKQPREWKQAKLQLWGHLHHARTVASVAAFGLVLYQIFGTDKSTFRTR